VAVSEGRRAPATDGSTALYAVRAVALVIAVAASVAAYRPLTLVVLAAGVTAALFAWRFRDRHLPALVALACGVILLAGAVRDASPDRDDVRVAVVALIIAGVVTVPLELRSMRPLHDGQSAPLGADLVVPIAVLIAVALVAFALGPSVNLESKPRSGSVFGGTTRVTEADGGDVAQGIAPYLGFSDRLDTASRGELGDEIVLRVHADAPDFWRGESFDVWDGREWHRDESARAEVVRAASNLPGGEAEPFRQHVKVEAAAIGTLYAAYRPMIVSLPLSSYTLNADGSIELDRPLGRGSEYTVQSLRPRVTADILRADGLLDGESSPEGTMRGPVPSRVEALARRITANAPTTYDAILAIEDWMEEHTTYTLDIPPLPKGADAVEQHLFVDRKGFCTQIATSTAVMLHSLGVPVRLGTGFTPGKESILGKDFTVRASDAHAWIEVWFPSVGWQAFDPTADVPLSGEYNGSLLARIWRALQRLVLALALLVAVIAFFVVRTIVRRRRRRRDEVWVHRMYRRVEREGRVRGRPRRPNETPQQYLRALSDDVLPQPDHLDVVADLVTVAAYGSRDLRPDEQQRAEAALDAAVAASPRRWLRRAARRREPVHH
jgi:transglutaminase-like putative cysteine protease